MERKNLYIGIFGGITAIGLGWWAWNKWGKKPVTETEPEPTKPATTYTGSSKNNIDEIINPAPVTNVGKNVYANADDVKVWADAYLKTAVKTVKKNIWVGVIASEVNLYGYPYYKLNGSSGTFLGYVLKANVYIK